MIRLEINASESGSVSIRASGLSSGDGLQQLLTQLGLLELAKGTLLERVTRGVAQSPGVLIAPPGSAVK